MITFVIGGARSGKSGFALAQASAHSGRKAYVATAQAFDDEMRARIERHRQERSDEWDTFEEPRALVPLLTSLQDRYDVVLVDCLTLWLSNLLLSSGDVETAIDHIVTCLSTARSHILLVSNEVGQGIVPENALARQFRDYAGTLNQRIAAVADSVFLVTAGIPLHIKGSASSAPLSAADTT